MKINIEFTENEIKELNFIVSSKLEGVLYAIVEVEDTPELQTRKEVLENILSKLNEVYCNENNKYKYSLKSINIFLAILQCNN